MSAPSIQFYLRMRDKEFYRLPGTLPEFGSWILRYQGMHGRLCWVLQTYLHLKDKLPLALTNRPPRSGIVFFHADDFLPRNNSSLYRVCIQGDRAPPDDADYYIVLNRREPKIFARLAAFVYPWPFAEMKARSEARGGRMERIVYTGWRRWLDPSLQAAQFVQAAANLGYTCDYRWEDRVPFWNDYSDSDIFLAVRSFDARSYLNKPARKLHNAWLAGVIPILGAEAAYLDERETDLDFLTAGGAEEVLAYLARLKKDSVLVRALQSRCRARAARLTSDFYRSFWEAALQSIVDRYTGAAAEKCRFRPEKIT